MELSLRSTKEELNTLLAAAKTTLPALEAVRSVELAEGTLRLQVDSPVGKLDVKVELALTNG